MSEEMTIGALSQQCGVKIPTIRYYEEIGLLPPAARTEGNRRIYSVQTAQKLRFIRHARALGFDLDAIRTLCSLADEPNHPCVEADRIARAHLADIESKIAQLSALREELVRMTGPCPHGQVSQCRVIEILADHDKCLHDHH